MTCRITDLLQEPRKCKAISRNVYRCNSSALTYQSYLLVICSNLSKYFEVSHWNNKTLHTLKAFLVHAIARSCNNTIVICLSKIIIIRSLLKQKIAETFQALAFNTFEMQTNIGRTYHIPFMFIYNNQEMKVGIKTTRKLGIVKW